jgi:hypothetical protein
MLMPFFSTKILAKLSSFASLASCSYLARGEWANAHVHVVSGGGRLISGWLVGWSVVVVVAREIGGSWLLVICGNGGGGHATTLSALARAQDIDTRRTHEPSQTVLPRNCVDTVDMRVCITPKPWCHSVTMPEFYTVTVLNEWCGN